MKNMTTKTETAAPGEVGELDEYDCLMDAIIDGLGLSYIASIDKWIYVVEKTKITEITYMGNKYEIEGNNTPILHDGRYHGPPTDWYYNQKTCAIIAEGQGDYAEEMTDWTDPNDDIWNEVAIQHPERWWDAMREIAENYLPDLKIMNIRVADHEEVLILVDTTEYPTITGMIPLSDLEKIDGWVGGDYDTAIYHHSDGNHYSKTRSRWQGSSDYAAELVTRCECGAWLSDDAECTHICEE